MPAADFKQTTIAVAIALYRQRLGWFVVAIKLLASQLRAPERN